MRQTCWLSPKCVVRADTSLATEGVFAAERILRDEVVILFGGIIRTTQEADAMVRSDPDFHRKMNMVADGFYITGLESDRRLEDTEQINHSCEPNLGIQGQIVLVARRDIEPGEELTWDYETSESYLHEPFRCNCRSPRCRGVIDGNAWKDPEFQRRNAGYLSWYLERKIAASRDAAAG